MKLEASGNPVDREHTRWLDREDDGIVSSRLCDDRIELPGFGRGMARARTGEEEDEDEENRTERETKSKPGK